MVSTNGKRQVLATFQILVLTFSTTLLTACLHSLPGSPSSLPTSPSPAELWKPKPSDVAPPGPLVATPGIPADLLEASEHLTLTDVVDIALRNSPQTQDAWSQARAAAAAYRSKQGAYYPELDVNADITYVKGSAVGGRFSYEQTTYGPEAELSYLLFNFGARKATVAEARQALLASNWTHNAVIQNVVLSVQQAYYDYLNNKALLQAQEATLKETQTNLDAAEERHKAGVATIADVLQAKTTFSQSLLTLESIRGQIFVTRGSLATAMGLPANTSFDAELVSEVLPVTDVSEQVERYIAEAQQKRPDLMAARSQAQQAAAHLKSVKRGLLPSLVASGSAGRDFYEETGGSSDNYTAGLTMQVPLFKGFSQLYDIRQAEAQTDSARARLTAMEQQATLQVWMSYYSFKTAEQQVRTSQDLLESAQQSHDVALGRYKAGVGGILDLLAAQSQLANARAQNVQARTNWFLALAQLAYDTGTLWLEGQGTVSPGTRNTD